MEYRHTCIVRIKPAHVFTLVLSCSILLAGCSNSLGKAQISSANQETPTQLPISQPSPFITSSPITPKAPAAGKTTEAASPSKPTSTALQETPSPALDPENWMNFPVIPTVSDNARAIYKKGLALGNKNNVFSKVGDCNSLPPLFLANFDDPKGYHLGTYTDLQAAIDHFAGSFQRESYALGNGFNSSTILSSLWVDLRFCNADENLLQCEYRTQKPGFAIIALGTDDYVDRTKFEANLRQIIETTIQAGIVPILATKVDDSNHQNFNLVTAKLAVEYDIPLWNLWAAMQPLPSHGLGDDIHPSGTFFAFDFRGDSLTQYGWAVRNFTALEALNAVWLGVTQP